MGCGMWHGPQAWNYFLAWARSFGPASSRTGSGGLEHKGGVISRSRLDIAIE